MCWLQLKAPNPHLLAFAACAWGIPGAAEGEPMELHSSGVEGIVGGKVTYGADRA